MIEKRWPEFEAMCHAHHIGISQEHVGEVTHEFSWDPNVGKATGKVFVKGEIWNAECQPDLVDALPAGTRVRVLYEEDLLVRVLGKAV